MTFSPWHSSDGTCPLKPSEQCRHLWAATCQEQVKCKNIINILKWKDKWRVILTHCEMLSWCRVWAELCFSCASVKMKMSCEHWRVLNSCVFPLLLKKDRVAVTAWHLRTETLLQIPLFESRFKCNSSAKRFSWRDKLSSKTKGWWTNSVTWNTLKRQAWAIIYIQNKVYSP